MNDGYEIRKVFEIEYRDGEEIVKEIFDTLKEINDSVNTGVIVCKDKKHGFVNNTKGIVLSVKYDEIIYNSDLKLLIVKYGKKYGVFTLTGKKICLIKYSDVNLENYLITSNIIVKKDGKYGIVKNKHEIVPLEYDKIEYVENEEERYWLCTKIVDGQITKDSFIIPRNL